VAAEDVAYAAIWGALTLYAVLGGADFGAGIWDLVTWTRLKPTERASLFGAIGPVWEANHVWLVFAIVLTFTAFPGAFAAMTAALWLPLFVALVGIVFRGAAFVFRAYGPEAARQEHRWSVAFGVASAATPLCFGAAAGAVAGGARETPTGPVVEFARPLPVVGALLAAAVCAYLAAVFLTREGAANRDEALVAAWRRRSLGAGVVAGALAILGVVAMSAGESAPWPNFRDRAGPLVLVSAAGASTSIVALWRRRFTVAAGAASVAVGSITAGWGIAQHPYLLPPVASTVDHAPSSVLRALLWSSAVGAAVLAPSLAFLFRLFKSMPKR
jgi:cytochrome d ubiquinol oxidase subunit II